MSEDNSDAVLWLEAVSDIRDRARLSAVKRIAYAANLSFGLMRAYEEFFDVLSLRWVDVTIPVDH